MDENNGVIRILLLDSEGVNSQLLADALNRYGSFKVAENSFRSALLDLKREDAELEIVLLGQAGSHQTRDVCDLTRQLLAVRPLLRIVLLCDQTGPNFVIEAFRAGARGLFHRDAPFESLCKCILAVHAGQIWATSQELDFLLQNLQQPLSVRIVDTKGTALLSEREGQIVYCVAEGLSNREIAQRLAISPHTVKNCLFRIFDKLGVSSRVELILYAMGQATAQPTGANGITSGTLTGNPPLDEPDSCKKMWFEKTLGLSPDPVTAYSHFVAAEEVSMKLTQLSQAVLRVLEGGLTADQRAKANECAALALNSSPKSKRAPRKVKSSYAA